MMIRHIPVYYPCRGSNNTLQIISKMYLNAMYGINGAPYRLIELLCKEIQKPMSGDLCNIYRDHEYRDDSIVVHDEIEDNIAEYSTFLDDDDYYVLRKRTCDSHLTDSEFSINSFTVSVFYDDVDYAHHGYSSMTCLSTFLLQSDFARRLTC